ncbi:MAG TPA: hypothetical protein PKW15_06230 [Alphaproteobacteria bacterium]|nr:hypothetical protein [Alphaproteobacteria bacterium]
MEALHHGRFVRSHLSSTPEDVRNAAINTVVCLLFNDSFFKLMRGQNIIPFYYAPYDFEETCQSLYIHKEGFEQSLANPDFTHYALQADYLAESNVVVAQRAVNDLEKLVRSTFGTDKFKLWDKGLRVVDAPLFERRARPMVENMADAFFPIMEFNFSLSRQPWPEPN